MMLWLVDSRPWNKSMICMHRNSVLKKHKTRISHVKPKEPIKMLDVF